jgi:hypothetical protein
VIGRWPNEPAGACDQMRIDMTDDRRWRSRACISPSCMRRAALCPRGAHSITRYRYYVSAALITEAGTDRAQGRRIVARVLGPRPERLSMDGAGRRFAADSPVEGDGFEPSVPRQKDNPRSTTPAIPRAEPDTFRLDRGSQRTRRWRGSYGAGGLGHALRPHGARGATCRCSGDDRFSPSTMSQIPRPAES